MKKVSFYKNVFEGHNEEIDLQQVLLSIKNGEYASQISQLRSYYNVDDQAYSRLKARLPAVTFSGVFADARKKDKLLTYTGAIVFDIDKVNISDVSVLSKTLSEDPFTFSAWVSPSNNGVKFLVLTNAGPQEHTFFFNALKHHYEAKYSIVIDKSGSDITRLCYISHDEKLILKSDFVTVNDAHINDYRALLVESPKQVASTRVIVGEKAEIAFNRGKGKNDPGDREMIKKIIKFLKSKKKSITSNYHNWLRVGFAIANTFSKDVGEKYFLELCRLDMDKHDEQRSQELLRDCYVRKIDNWVTFSTIIFLAQNEGFDVNKAGFSVGKIEKA